MYTSHNHFSFHPQLRMIDCVTMVIFDWQTVETAGKAEWSCASMESGGRCVMMHLAVAMPRWCVTSLEILQVCRYICITPIYMYVHTYILQPTCTYVHIATYMYVAQHECYTHIIDSKLIWCVLSASRSRKGYAPHPNRFRQIKS